MVDLDGNQLKPVRRSRTSEILLHLTIMKERPDVRAVVHRHPPHATAFAVTRQAIPQCILPEIEVFMAKSPLAPYETRIEVRRTPSSRSSRPQPRSSSRTTARSASAALEEAYRKTEILDAYCKILILRASLA
ncbi:MAG: class II aldolase/adducin family protein [Planctomycetaceae bacterium]